MPRLFFLLLCALLVSGCKFSAKDLPNLLEFYEQPEHARLLPKSFDGLIDANTAGAFYDKLKTFTTDVAGLALVERPMLHTEGIFGRSLFLVGTIEIGSEMGPDGRLSTLLHELAHFCSYGTISTKTEGEVVAESVALVVLAQFKELEPLIPYSLVYLLNVASEKTRTEQLKFHAATIQRCADDLTGALR
jgi:hypothetical protein